MSDPKTDPRPGDVLRKGKWTREVSRIGHEFGWTKSVEYFRVHAKTNLHELRSTFTPQGWWRWARNAEVVTVAEEAKDAAE